MESAKNALERIKNAVSNLTHLSEKAETRELTEDEKTFLDSIVTLKGKFEAAMDDDFNTADAIAAIFEMVKAANTNLSADSAKQLLDDTKKYIVELTAVLGVDVDVKEELLDAEIESLIQDRQDARKNRDFAKADEIRDLLLEKGIILEDTREG